MKSPVAEMHATVRQGALPATGVSGKDFPPRSRKGAGSPGRRTICLVGTRWTRERAEGRNCEAREHRHVTLERAMEMVRTGGAEWLVGGRVIRATAAAAALNRLSIRVGETLAMMVYRGNAVGRQMLAEIRRKT